MQHQAWHRLVTWHGAWLAASEDERLRLRAQLAAEDPHLDAAAERLVAGSIAPEGFLETPAFLLAARDLAEDEMPLGAGTMVGPYQVLGLLARGGMGTVYRAADVRLNRPVALKMIAETTVADPHLAERFAQEARATASLNHPNIVCVYDVGVFHGRPYLVAELLEGETVRGRLTRGALPVADACGIVLEAARGLAAAHAAGLVHRDLKPENLFLTSAGVTKILDFGIAKEVVQHDPGRERLATLTGVLLGTAGYLAPEQVRGDPVDARTDLFALGAILFEMLSGERAFAREHTIDTLHAIVHEPAPDLLDGRDGLSLAITAIVRRLLEKSPDARFQSASDLESALARESAHLLGEPADRTPPRRLRLAWRRWKPHTRGHLARWMTGGALATLCGMALWLVSARSPEPRSTVRVAIELPPLVSLSAMSRGASVAISPDGRRIVYTAAVGTSTTLYHRSLDRLDHTQIAGTDGGRNPFFSPDGRWIGFWTSGALKKVRADGGPVTTITDHVSPLGAAWAADDTLVFAPLPWDGLWRVAASGGSRTRVTTLPDSVLNHLWPQVLAGNAVLFTIWTNEGFAGGRVAVQPMNGGPPAILIDGASYGRVVSVPGGPAYLVFARPEGLFAARFDVGRLRLAGPPVPVLDGVLTNLSGGAHFSVSSTGVLAYVPGGLDEAYKTLLIVDRSGKETELRPVPGIGFQYRLSPDGRRLARPNANGPQRDLWIDEIEGRRTSTRLTFAAHVNAPIWTPDGKRIIYASGLPNGNLFWRAADGSGGEERLATSTHMQVPESVSPDGTTLAYVEANPGIDDIWLLSLRGSRRPRLFLGTPASEGQPRFSPNGRWLAYASNQSGRAEIHLASFPDGSRRVQISTGGGFAPLWAADGRELFYRTVNTNDGGGHMMAVSIDPEGVDPMVGAPRVLFESPYQANGDVTADGRFILLRRGRPESPTRVIQLVLNWFDDLQAKVPER